MSDFYFSEKQTVNCIITNKNHDDELFEANTMLQFFPETSKTMWNFIFHFDMRMAFSLLTFRSLTLTTAPWIVSHHFSEYFTRMTGTNENHIHCHVSCDGIKSSSENIEHCELKVFVFFSLLLPFFILSWFSSSIVSILNYNNNHKVYWCPVHCSKYIKALWMSHSAAFSICNFTIIVSFSFSCCSRIQFRFGRFISFLFTILCISD